MKTAGQLLQEKRLAKELSLEAIAKSIKVRPAYLEAIENSDFARLPSATFTKGFLRNYARVLHLNPETILAMFRRDFTESHEGKIIPKGLLAPVARKPHLLAANLILGALLVFTFLGFLGFQIYHWLELPKMSLIQPLNGEIYLGKVTIKGQTDPDVVITINNQKVLVDQNGQFSLDLSLPVGTHSVVVQAENRAGKIRLTERTFQIAK